MKKPVLGYWKQRSLAEPLRMIFHFAKVDYENYMFEAGGPPDFSRDVWFNVKNSLGLDFPNLPYFRKGDFNISETLAIFQYICGEYRPSLLGESCESRGKIFMLLSFLHDLKLEITMPCYESNFLEIIGRVIDQSKEKFEKIKEFLGNKRFLMGDEVTAPDFLLYETIDMFEAISLESADAAFNDFKLNFQSLEGMEEYLTRPRLPWNNTRAYFK